MQDVFEKVYCSIPLIDYHPLSKTTRILVMSRIYTKLELSQNKVSLHK